MRKYKIEICANSAESAIMAQRGGANRVELCAGMPEGGTTPSFGEIAAARNKLKKTKLHVIIRPRGGDFCYSPAEIKIMAVDIDMANSLGVDGFVFGCLTPEGDVDTKAMRKLIKATKGKSITFHRAFDVCRDPLRAFEQIVSLGCDRLLTSGHERTAEEGIPLIRQLVDMRKTTRRGEEFIVMPGSGVNVENAARILKETGAKEIHGSLRKDGHTDVGMVRSVVATIS